MGEESREPKNVSGFFFFKKIYLLSVNKKNFKKKSEVTMATLLQGMLVPERYKP
jgi:hypothetical protein